MICVDGTVVGVDYLTSRRGSGMRSPALLSGLPTETRVVSRAAGAQERGDFGGPHEFHQSRRGAGVGDNDVGLHAQTLVRGDRQHTVALDVEARYGLAAADLTAA